MYPVWKKLRTSRLPNKTSQVSQWGWSIQHFSAKVFGIKQSSGKIFAPFSSRLYQNVILLLLFFQVGHVVSPTSGSGLNFSSSIMSNVSSAGTQALKLHASKKRKRWSIARLVLASTLDLRCLDYRIHLPLRVKQKIDLKVWVFTNSMKLSYKELKNSKRLLLL